MKTPEIFLTENTGYPFMVCPYCKDYSIKEVDFCYKCKKRFHFRSETLFYAAKDCKRNGEEHDFKYNKAASKSIFEEVEICTKCGAKRCK